MRSDEFLSILSKYTEKDEDFENMKKNLPLGVDSAENVVYARTKTLAFSCPHVCVTGSGKGAFIRRLLITLSCLYERQEACFFLLSPSEDYGELLRMKAMDLTLPYVRDKADFTSAIETLKELLRIREYGKGYPRLFVVLDGLETLEGCNRNEDLEEYRELFDLLARRENVEVITGVELTKSIFSGYPGAFVGVESCLVATRESGKADITYVQSDGSLTLPMPMRYPDAPSLTETVLFFNSVPKDAR